MINLAQRSKTNESAGHDNSKDGAKAQTEQANYDPGSCDGPKGEQVAELVAVLLRECFLVKLDRGVD